MWVLKINLNRQSPWKLMQQIPVKMRRQKRQPFAFAKQVGGIFVFCEIFKQCEGKDENSDVLFLMYIKHREKTESFSLTSIL